MRFVSRSRRRPARFRTRPLVAVAASAAAVTGALAAHTTGGHLGPAANRSGAEASKTTSISAELLSTSSVPGGVNFGSSYEQTYDHLPAAKQAAVMARIASAGAKWIRVDVPMSGEEWEPGQYVWYVTPEISQAISHHINVLGVISFPASWAGGTSHPNLTEFATFARNAAAHFSKLGVHAWEIWNEPNNGIFAPNHVVSPAWYVSLLKAVYPALKAGDASDTVVTGGLAPEPNKGTTDLSPQTFLTDIYNDGAAGYFDAVGDHPYSYPDLPDKVDSWNPFTYLPRLHNIMTAHGDGAKKIWYTEYGAPTAGRGAVSQATQATMFTQAFAKARTWSWSGPLFAYDWEDSADGSFGLTTSTGVAKAALSTFTAATSPTA